ncbi:MAG: flagellar basal body P-ring formation protein FlgA [Planctomycetes bacterium]|nr:flagellar basal body P-ring formation protein FlgA [Planctomycetota bacterium]
MQDAARTIRCGVKRRSDCRGRWVGRCGAACGLAAVLSTFALGADVTSQPATGDLRPSQEIAVRLHGTAIVGAEQVTLGDIAEIRGDLVGLAGSCPIILSPKPGYSLSLSIDDVQKALSDRGANLAHWTFRGSSRCTVTRPVRREIDQSTPSQRRDDRPAPANTSPGLPGQAVAEVPSETAPINPDTLGGSMQLHMQQRLADLGGTPVIQFPKALSQQLELSRPTYEFRITCRGNDLLGLVPLDVTIVDSSKQEQTLQVSAKVSLRKTVLVAGHSINKGAVVAASDVSLQELVFDRVEDIGLADPAAIIGQQAKRFVDKGDKLLAKDFEPLPLVHRNDLVTVLISRGSLRIKGTARALGSGAFGDVVDVRNEMGERSAGRFSAVVVGEKTVEVPVDDRPTSTAPAGRGGI